MPFIRLSARTASRWSPRRLARQGPRANRPGRMRKGTSSARPAAAASEARAPRHGRLVPRGSETSNRTVPVRRSAKMMMASSLSTTVVDLFVDALHVRTESLTQCHSSASVVICDGCSAGLVTGRPRGSRAALLHASSDGRSRSGRSGSRDCGPAAFAMTCALFVARERRKGNMRVTIVEDALPPHFAEWANR
jgi:hypothetical protein